jgi:hypothetical protein
MADAASLETNWLVLTPSWTFTQSNPPVLETISGQSPLWLDTAGMIQAAKQADLTVALRPVAQFPTQTSEWWQTAGRDFSWWVSWFNNYEAFILHHADLATAFGAADLILGGDWMAPATPNGNLTDGTPSGVPPDAAIRYRGLINRVRQRYSGRIGWALSYPDQVVNPPEYLDAVDFLYILWDEPLASKANPEIGQMQAVAEGIITGDLYLLWLAMQIEGQPKDIILSVAYPSVEGGVSPCLADPHQECILPQSLNYPAPDYPLLELDLGLQARAYYAVLAAVSQHSWIKGVVSRGYYPPTPLQDKSISIHGKPAEEVLKAWYLQLLESGE